MRKQMFTYSTASANRMYICN